PPAALCDFLGVSQISDPEDFLKWKYRPGYLPLASVGQKPVFADEATAFRAITSAEFDPRFVVYLPVEARSVVSVAREPTPDPSQEGNFTGTSVRGLPSEGGAGGGFAARAQENKRAAQSVPPNQSTPDTNSVSASFTAHRGEIQTQTQDPTWLVVAQTF